MKRNLNWRLMSLLLQAIYAQILNLMKENYQRHQTSIR